jgi:pyruvate formate lyase activating enzyme
MDKEKDFSRREFIGCSLTAFCGLSLTGTALTKPAIALPESDDRFLKEARYFKKLSDKRVLCTLCPRGCRVPDGERGYCGCRENRGGNYYTLVYSRACSAHIDPIEKKPLFHFHPGSPALSFATAGCNIECKFCQNWNISQFRPEQLEARYITPEKMVEIAKANGCPVIAYTYNEPTVFYEYMYDTAAEGKKQGIKSVMISNGFMNSEPMKALTRVLSAVKVDLKSFSEKFYRDVCSGQLKPVLDTLLLLKEIGIWYEIVVLLIPTLNDSKTELDEMTRWVRKNLGPDVPIHFSRFFPTYKITNLPPTPVATLERAREIALANGLNFVYTGNVPGHPGEHTYCPACGKILIRRIGFRVLENNIEQGKCKFCGRRIPGIW